jgi:hypothetical protein
MALSLPRTDEIDAPEVSVVIPVRDGARYLPSTWNTVRRSRGVRFEVVVVDDGSDDETPMLLSSWAASESRLRWVRGARLGLVPALNAGLQMARAPYVARLDSDDLVHPDRLARQLDLARRNGWAVVGSGIRCFPASMVKKGLRRYEAWQNGLVDAAAMARERFVESPFVHPSVLFHRETVLRFGGYRECGWPEDYDLWLRLFAAGVPMGKSPEILTWWRDHGARLTRTSAHCSPGALAACKATHLLAGPLRDRARVYIAGAGDDAKRIARALADRGRPIDGFLDLHPRRLGQRIGGSPVVTLEAVRDQLGPEAMVLVAIGGEGRRAGLRAYFAHHGLREPEEVLFVA